MSTSDSRVETRKALIASALTAAIAIGGSAIFLMGDSEPRIAAATERTSPTLDIEGSSRTARPLPPPQAAPAPGSASNQQTEADDSLIALHERSTALAVELSRLSSSQAQTEARIQEIAVRMLGSKIEVPSYEQQQVQMPQFRTEVERQRHIVEKYEKEAVTLAREHGIPESAVLSDTFGEVQRHTAGRSIPDLIKAQTNVIHNRKILEAAEKRYNELSQIQTLPPKKR